MSGALELPPHSGTTFHAFCDPSGGSSDSMTLAVAHSEKDIAVLDLLREVRPPFTPSSVVAEFCADMKRYGISTVTGDYYGAEWVHEQFEKLGINYTRSENPKSDIYLSFLPAVNSRQVWLLDNARLKAQLAGLVRRTRSGGKDSVDHRAGGHDDLANVAAGALVLAGAGIGVFGLLDWFKAGGAEHMLADIDKKPATVTAPSKPVESVPDVLVCPSCSSTQTQTLAGDEKRCAECGKQWWPNGAPRINYGPSRKDLFSGRLSR
jgi:hypothetical protein